MAGTARVGMSTLVSTIRGFCNLGTDDYTLGTSTYWSDENVEIVLDRHRTTVVREELAEVVDHTGGGTIEYKEFRSHFGNFEETTGGTAIFILENAEGGDLATTLYSVDYANGIITFGTTQAGSSRYLTGRSYDVFGAAADAYRVKAGAYSEAVNFKTDNMSVNRGELIKNCMRMASNYAALGYAQTVNMIRDDSV